MERKLQTNDVDERKSRVEDSIQQIKGIEQVIESEELDAICICSLTMTEDKRIASGGKDGNISVSSYDLTKKKWNRDIHKEMAHNSYVTSLCPLNGNRLLSGGLRDYLIKIWSLSDVKLTLIKEIKAHTSSVHKISPLSKERFASCSSDGKVRIWKDDNTYKCLSTLKRNGSFESILNLFSN